MSVHPHLILLPGLHGTDDLWGPLLAVIPADVLRTIVVYPPSRPLSREELIELIERSAPADAELVVVAESFSGPLGVEFAARHPERVKALILCASFIRPPWPAWMCRIVATVARYFMRPMMVVRGWLPDRWADATVGRASRDALRHVSPEVLASRLRIVAQADGCEALRRCSMPVVYLQSARDIVIRPRCLREVLKIRPDTRVVVLDCSHMVLQRRPREAWAAICEAMSGTGSQSPAAEPLTS